MSFLHSLFSPGVTVHSPQALRAAVPNHFAPETGFMEDNFFFQKNWDRGDSRAHNLEPSQAQFTGGFMLL